MEMKIKSRSGTEMEKAYAARLLPIITRHHLLLVTLMLWNACANEALPIFLNALVPEWLAIVLSVTMVLFVGEIIPAALLTGPNQLQIVAGLAPLVYSVLFVFYPLSYPISMVLDCWLGHDESVTTYNRKEIATLMSIQHEEGNRRREVEGGSSVFDAVHYEEVAIIGGALKFRDMTVSEVMTPVERVFMLSSKDRLSYKASCERGQRL
jgi:CBS domain containing-hemolysin-like protein